MAVQFIQTPFPSSSYNDLPDIDDMAHAAAANAEALKELLTIILAHGQDYFLSVHLVHKHYTLKTNRIMVYETVRGSDHSDFILASPKDPLKCTDARGLYFKAQSDNLVAYEFSTDPGKDISSSSSSFLAVFHRCLVLYRVQNVYGLTVKSPDMTKITEIEMPDASATILTQKPTVTITGDAYNKDL